MSDPRQEDRLRAETWTRPPSLMPTQVMERIKQKLSPCDDELPFAQAVRQKEEMAKAAKAYRKRAGR